VRYRTGRSDEKQRIARAAAELVEEGTAVGLTGGTTTTEVARALATRQELTVVTNASEHRGRARGAREPEADRAPAASPAARPTSWSARWPTPRCRASTSTSRSSASTGSTPRAG
jgi:hypothetical protein